MPVIDDGCSMTSEERPVVDPDCSPLFRGLYEPTEASRFIANTLSSGTPLRVPSSKLIYWIRRGLADRELAGISGRDLILSFEDLISMRVIAALRAAGVKFSRIYEAEQWLRRVTGYRSPFATEMLWTERADVFVEMKSRLIAASRSGQYAFAIIEQYLVPVHGLTFDIHHVARTWEPRQNIVLDPLVQFGSPCIKGTRIPSRTLWGMVRGGDRVEYVARSFRIATEHVQDAIEWEESLTKS